MEHVRSVRRILLDWYQFEGTTNLAQRFLFSAQSGINQGKDAKCGTKLCLFLHNFFLFGATRFESGPRLIFVLQHPPEQATAERSTELHLVVAKGGVPERVEGCFRPRGIAVCQSTEEPNIGDTLDCARVFRANLINRLMQRSSITFPVE